MKAKGCISEVLEWPTAREFFYWRIRRRQAEDPLKDLLVSASNGALTLDTAAERVSEKDALWRVFYVCWAFLSFVTWQFIFFTHTLCLSLYSSSTHFISKLNYPQLFPSLTTLHPPLHSILLLPIGQELDPSLSLK